ncbi:hypothetical protein [Rhodohalobacter sp.]|uniref:hypothetical protein n=1 Tax=Rhodohalobacter sp. TaxID=1974210 RepID=UPI003561D0EC
MSKTPALSNDIELFRPVLRKIIPAAWLMITGIFLIHTLIRFGGIWNPLFIPISMMILWPIPWLFSTREARNGMGFKIPISNIWFF